jgi:hypothetical protein
MAPHDLFDMKSIGNSAGFRVSMKTDVVDVLATGSEGDVPDGYSFRNPYLGSNGRGNVCSLDMSDSSIPCEFEYISRLYSAVTASHKYFD